MKTLITAMVLASAVALPAFGKSAERQTREPGYAAAKHSPAARHARQGDRRLAVRQPCAAYWNGACVGWDPDPNVRLMLWMDRGHNDD
jgi:hypothetical protein